MELWSFEFPVLLSCNQKLSGTGCDLRYSSCLYHVSPWWVREGLCFFPLGLAAMSTGYSGWNVATDPSWPASTVAVSAGARWAMGGWRGINSWISSSFFFFPSGDEGCSTIASTLCTTSLLLSLSSTSKCTCHSGWNAPSDLPSTGCNLTLHC